MSTAKNTSPEMRSVIAQGAIALAACIGGYMFFVDAKSARLAASRVEEQSLSAQARAAEALRDMAPQLTSAVNKAKAEADRIHHHGRLARQEQELYAALTSAANACRVRIDQMSPNKPAGPGRNTTGAAEQTDAGPNASVGYTIDATATYTDLAMFLKSIRTDLGYSVVKSVRLTPSTEAKGKYVHAFIETEHYSFDASPVGLEPGATAQAGGGH